MVKDVTAITMPKAMIDRLDVFLETDFAKERGFTSRPSVFMMLLREFFDKTEMYIDEMNSVDPKRFEYIRREKNDFIIKDKKLDEQIILREFEKYGQTHCMKCKDKIKHCQHQKFLVTLFNSIEQIAGNNVKLPDKYSDMINHEFEP